jgi:hypothetical protein
MDGSAFDRLVRHISEEGSRRGLLRSALGAAVGLGAVSVIGDDEAEARKNSCKRKCNDKKGRKKRECKKACNCAQEGKFLRCTNDDQCCSKKHLVCDVPFGAGNSDKNCCRGQGATCTTSDGPGPYCCTGEAGIREFTCVGGVCQECLGAACPP